MCSVYPTSTEPRGPAFSYPPPSPLSSSYPPPSPLSSPSSPEKKSYLDISSIPQLQGYQNPYMLYQHGFNSLPPPSSSPPQLYARSTDQLYSSLPAPTQPSSPQQLYTRSPDQLFSGPAPLVKPRTPEQLYTNLDATKPSSPQPLYNPLPRMEQRSSPQQLYLKARQQEYNLPTEEEYPSLRTYTGLPPTTSPAAEDRENQLADQLQKFGSLPASGDLSFTLNSYLYNRYNSIPEQQPPFPSSYPLLPSSYNPSSSSFPTSSTIVQNVADSSTDLYTDQQPSFYPPVLLKTSSSAGKTKKKRTEFSQSDIRFLENSFSVSDFARGARRDEIARQLDVKPRSVTIWFQNKRAKLRAQCQQMSLLKKAAETGVVSGVEKIPDFR